MDTKPEWWYLPFMRKEELDNLTEQQLLANANGCFIKADLIETVNHLSVENRLRFPWDARKKASFSAFPRPCVGLVDSGFSLNVTVPLSENGRVAGR